MSSTEHELPSLSQLEDALQQERYKQNYRSVLRSTVFCLITVAAVAVLVATLFLPVLQIYGSSMTPSLYEGDIVVSVKDTELQTGDVVSFYYNNKILVKRAIAFSGDWVEIDEEGNVYVNSQLLEEPYLEERALGQCDLEFPYQVPEGRVFVLGDHRVTSVDSRSSTVGTVTEEQLVGKIIFRIWPLSEMGAIR